VDETMSANGFHHMMRLTNASESYGIIIIFARDERLESTILKGPSVTMGGPVEQFLKAHKSALGTLLWMDKIYAIERPRYATPKELLQSFISDKKVVLPSTLDRKTARLYVGKLPEEIAKMAYQAYWEKINI
jgi:hypothetical protein